MKKLMIVGLLVFLAGCEQYDCRMWRDHIAATEQCIAESSCMLTTDDIWYMERNKRRIYRVCEDA